MGPAKQVEPSRGTFPAVESSIPLRVGRFEIRACIGSGAVASVYRAWDPQLDREVALKVPHAWTLETPRAVQRFLREARAVARLQHPHIIPVYDAGQDGPQHYLAAACIEGRPLADLLREGPLGFRRAAHIVQSLAEALAHAHGLGIVHRDVKPDNVLLDERGTAHLTDFGLAYLQEEAEKLTQDGAVLGTPAYMAPEQARGKHGEPLPASDQYSLGVVLYELLCGQPPFTGSSAAVLANVLQQDPDPPRRRHPRVPRDLETICLKALTKQPEGRYRSCQELAADLRRWLEGEPIQARPCGPVERLVRWFLRNPVRALGTTTAALCLASAAVVAAVSAARSAQLARSAAEARQAAEEGQQREAEARARAEAAEGAETEERRSEEEQRAELAAAVARAKQQEQAAAEARRQEEAAAQKLREEVAQLERKQEAEKAARREEEAEIRRLRAQLVESARLPLQTTALAVRSRSNLAFGSGGQHIVAGSGEVVVVAPTAAGKEVERLGKHPSPIISVAFSADGRRLASASEDGVVKVWDFPARKLIASHPKEDRRINRAALSADGRQLATAHGLRIVGSPSEVRLRDALTGQRTASWSDPRTPVLAVAFSPDGKTVAAANHDGTVKLWDVERKGLIRSFQGHKAAVHTVAFTWDGKRLATAASEVKIWDTATGQELLSLAACTCVAPSLDGQRLATVTGPDVMLRDANDGKVLFTYRASSGDVLSLAFSPDGKRLASLHADGTLRIWNADLPEELLRSAGSVPVW